MNTETAPYLHSQEKEFAESAFIKREYFLVVAGIFLISRLALLWFNDAEFTDGYQFIRWSFSEPAKRHPLYPLFIQGVSLFMDPIIAGRLISIFAGLLCLPSLISLARRLYGPKAALIAASLFCASPQVLFLNTRVLSESLFLAVTLAAVLYFMKSMKDQQPYDYFLLVLFSGLSLLTRPEGILLAPMIVLAAFSLMRRRCWRNLFYGIPALLPWILYLLWSHSHRGYQNELMFSYSTGSATKFLTYLFDYFDIYPYTVFWPVFVLAFFRLFRPADAHRKLWLFILLYFHIAIFAGIGIHWAWSTRFLILPVCLLLVEAGGSLADLSNKISVVAWNRLVRTVVVSSAIFAVVALYFQKQTYGDIKESALYIRDHLKEGRIFTDESIKTYYYIGRPINQFKSDASYLPGDIITLHSFHTPFITEFNQLQQRYDLEFLFTAESKITPLLANTLLERQRSNLPVALTERFREQKFYSAVARVRAIR